MVKLVTADASNSVTGDIASNERYYTVFIWNDLTDSAAGYLKISDEHRILEHSCQI